MNDSPLAGREGKLLTARQIKDRLVRETRTNVSIIVTETETAGHLDVKARGEMQIAILVEQMRREGFVSCSFRVPRSSSAATRRATSSSRWRRFMSTCRRTTSATHPAVARQPQGRDREHAAQPAQRARRGDDPDARMIGFETDLVNVTKGHGIASHLFKAYGPHKGDIPSRNNGVLVSMEGGTSTAYATGQHPGARPLFIGPQEEIYEGMIVGENARPDDMPCESLQGQEAHQHAKPG